MRRALMILLAIGAIVGFAVAFGRPYGFRHWHAHGGCYGASDCHERESFERHIADVCVRAAQNASAKDGSPAPMGPAPGGGVQN